MANPVVTENAAMPHNQVRENMQDKITYVDVGDVIVKDDWNARSGDYTKFVDPETGEGWDSFLASIHADGIKTPLEGRKVGNNGKVELVAGFRRYKASQTTEYKTTQDGKEAVVKVAKIEKLPIIIREMTEEQARLRNLQENTARESLKGADLAHGIRALFLAGGSKITDQKMAAELGISQPYVSKLHKIMVEVKPPLVKHWREKPNTVTVKQMYALTTIEKSRQDEEFAKLLAKEEGEGNEGGRNKWKKTVKKNAFDLGVVLGTLEREELAVISTNEAKPGVGVQWLDILRSGVIKYKKDAKLPFLKTAADQIAKGFAEGLKPPVEDAEDDEDDEDDDEE